MSVSVDSPNPEPNSDRLLPDSSPNPLPDSPSPHPSLPPEPNASMVEYYQLQQRLLLTSVVLAIVASGFVWLYYSLNTALNYLIGAFAGVVYLRMLGKSVGELGRQRKALGSSRLAVFIGLIVVATQWQQLHVVPIFLGFLTYKFAVIVYILQTTFSPSQTSAKT